MVAGFGGAYLVDETRSWQFNVGNSYPVSQETYICRDPSDLDGTYDWEIAGALLANGSCVEIASNGFAVIVLDRDWTLVQVSVGDFKGWTLAANLVSPST